MSVFESLPVDAINNFAAAKSWFDRVQQKIKIAFEKLEAKPILPVKIVASSGSVNSYQVTESDVYLVVNSRGGPMKIILPPLRATQSVIVLNAYGGGAVTIVQSNAKPFENAPAVVTLDYNKTTEFVNSSNGWFQFGRS